MPVTTTPHGSHRASAAKTRKRLKHLRVKRASNGGFTVSHHYHPEHGGTPKADTHAFSSYDEMDKHVESTMRGHR